MKLSVNRAGSRYQRRGGSSSKGVSATGYAGIALILALLIASHTLSGKEKDAVQYGMGLIVNVPFPEAEVEQVVQDVVQNGIIRGTKEYNKDEYVTGANAANSTKVFPEWAEGGKAFYKVRLSALDPLNFKNSGDMGTLAVRYVVQTQGDKNTVLRINAVFVEDFRHVSHASNGSVESAEFKDIHDRLEERDAMRAEAAEAQRKKQAHQANAENPTLMEAAPSAPAPGTANFTLTPVPATVAATSEPTEVSVQSQPETINEHVQKLRRQAVRLVKAPGAALKSAPFHTAATLHSLPTGMEVLIVISTPYWFGVETHDGQHGWILRDELELVP